MLSNGHDPPYEIDHGPTEADLEADIDRYQVRITSNLYEILYFSTFLLN